MDRVAWGIIGCGDVTEVKSGPAFQKARDSSLVAVMRRDRAKAADYARRHGVPRYYDSADGLIGDPEVSAVYIATPPSSHCELALQVAASGKPCLVEKPMAAHYAECVRMIGAFRDRHVPLYVAYYRRALPKFLAARDLLRSGAIGKATSVHVFHYERLAVGEAAQVWRVDPAIAGAGFFLDLASHGIDLLDFLLGPVSAAAGEAVNSGGTYAAEDVTAAHFRFESGVVGTGIWNFHTACAANGMIITGSAGELRLPVFTDAGLVVVRDTNEETIPFRNPPHIHQPFVQTVVDELLGRGRCESTGESGARASWVMDRCIERYYGRDRRPSETSARAVRGAMIE